MKMTPKIRLEAELAKENDHHLWDLFVLLATRNGIRIAEEEEEWAMYWHFFMAGFRHMTRVKDA